MPATETASRSVSPLVFSGSIRNAAQRDLAGVARLLQIGEVEMRGIEAAVSRSVPRCHVLVFDLEGVVRAVAHVIITVDRGLRGRLEFVVVDPTLARMSSRVIHERMTGVAIALCEAHGCAAIDVAATPRNDVTAVPQVLAACVG